MKIEMVTVGSIFEGIGDSIPFISGVRMERTVCKRFKDVGAL